MESNGKFTLIVFNTCTQEYEEVIVTEEVYRTYCRTRWNIKDNDQSFFDHEIQTSGMIGSQDGAYENFREFIDAINTPEHIILEQIKKEALYQAISALPAADQALVQGLFFKGQSELDYRKVYFRIRSRYQFDSGWPAETDAAKFHEESRSLFQSAGWDLQPGGDSTSDTVTKGWQELYCIR